MPMERLEQPAEGSRLDQLREAILKAPQELEEEFARTANPWLSCFRSSIFVVETYLSSPKVEALLSPEAYRRALQQMEELKGQVQALEELYPDKATVPPEEVKRELLSKLDVLGEG